MPILHEYDRVRLQRILAAQYGVITRSQVLACGLTTAMLEYRMRPGGPWQRILTGVYLTTTGTPTQVQRLMAAQLYAGPRSMITGLAAIRVYGLADADPDLIKTLVPEDSTRKSTSFVRTQRTARMPSEHVDVGPLRYAPLVRAVADAARDSRQGGEVEALVCRVVQRGRCTPEELAVEADEGQMQGSRLLRQAVRLVAGGVRSNPEGDLKRLIDRSGVEKPVYNAMLYSEDGTFLGCPDAWWERAGVAAEVDSVKYHTEAPDRERTSKKHNRMTVAGIDVLHWFPGTIRREPDMIIAELKEALRKGNARPKLPIITNPPPSRRRAG